MWQYCFSGTISGKHSTTGKAAMSASQFVFISYASANRELVNTLATDLKTRGVQFWIDRDGLKPGMPNWELAIRDALNQCAVLLYMVTPESLVSNPVKGELAIAQMLGRPILPIWIKGEQWANAAQIEYISAQRIDARPATYAAALDQIVQAIAGYTSGSNNPAASTTPAAPLPTFEPRNPYKGLKAFTEADKGDFFGRDDLIRDLLADVETLRDTRFLAVIGASGSGKSSVVKAGVIPRLRERHPNWIILPPLSPGASPLRALTNVFAKHSGKSNTAIREDLESPAGDGLDMLARNLADETSGRVLLIIDQFEELFTQTTNEDERRQFITLLTHAVTEPDGLLTVILTMRADFYDRPLNYEALGKLFESHQRTIPPLNLSDLKDTILKPAALPDVQLRFEEGLAADLVFAVRERTGALPLLQFTLDQLFQRREGHLLTHAAYQAMGGVSGALQAHADSIYKGLPTDTHRDLTKALFLKLIEPGATEQDTTRRRLPNRALELEDAAQNAMLQEVVAAFVSGRLITTDMDALEVSHEALIRE
jgi:energy-coupling factor transporter ATP-binding protein EcfA2